MNPHVNVGLKLCFSMVFLGQASVYGMTDLAMSEKISKLSILPMNFNIPLRHIT